jgi:UDP-glucose 4-epimerase
MFNPYVKGIFHKLSSNLPYYKDEMKTFVTGGAGFIGSYLTDRLVKENKYVTIYDNLSSGKLGFIKHHLNEENFNFIQADLQDAEKLNKAMRGHEFVWHLAANPNIRLGTERPDTDLKQNTIATFNVLEAMRLNNIKKIAFTSSSTVYGETKKIPTPEDYGPLIPISFYGASKLACEGLITAYSHTFDMQSWIFRLANIVGERYTSGVIIDFIEKLKENPNILEILGNGKQKKSYLTVEECVDAMLFSVENSGEKVNIFNIGAEDQITINRIAEILIEELELNNVVFRYTGGKRGWKGDVAFMMLSTTKINELGWYSKYTSEQAVRDSIKRIIKERRY